MAKNCEWDARENPACDCEVPSGFWQPWAWGQDDVLGHQWPSDVSADGFGKKWYQKSRRGKRRSNERSKTLNYLRRSWHELNKEYQRCYAEGQTFEACTWVYQNVNMEVHLRHNATQPTKPPPLTPSQMAEVQESLIMAFKSNDGERYWKMFYQNKILSMAREFDSDEDTAGTGLVDWCTTRVPQVKDTAPQCALWTTHAANPPGLASPNANPVFFPVTGCTQEPWGQPRPVQPQQPLPQEVPEKPEELPEEKPRIESQQKPPTEPPEGQPPPVESQQEPRGQPPPVEPQTPLPPDGQPPVVRQEPPRPPVWRPVLGGRRSTWRFIGPEDCGCVPAWLVQECCLWLRT
jgi:hypothetical protein